MIIKKDWGIVERIDRTAETTIDKLVIQPISKCSLHRHANIANCFYVLKGKLHVRFYSVSFVACFGSANGTAKQISLLEKYELLSGDSLVVAPGTWHEFSTGEKDTEVIEVSYKQSPEDIERA